jgi:hypothetical protein
MGRRPILIAGPVLVAASSCLIAVAQSFAELLIYRLIGGAAMEMWRQSSWRSSPMSASAGCAAGR